MTLLDEGRYLCAERTMYIEKALNDRDFIDLYFEQANVFSAIVGMFGTKALDSVSSYEKHRHSFTAQTRFSTTGETSQ